MIFSERRLKFCVRTPIANGIGAAAEYDDPAWPRYVRITDIAGPRELRSNTFASLPPEVALEASFEVGDLLAASVGATFGKTYLHTQDIGLAAYAGYLTKISLNKDFDPGFVSYWTESNHYWHQIMTNVVQSTIQNFSASKYAELRLPAPTLRTQRTIADYLDRETARLDALVAEKERLLDLLAEQRRALTTHVVTKGLDPDVLLKDSGIPWLGKIPAHWEVTRLKFIASVQTGIALGKSFGNKPMREYPYLRVANVQDGYLDLTEVKSIFVPDEEASLPYLRPGDVLMNEGGDADKLGRGAIWTGQINPCLHQNHVFAVRPRRISPDWLNSYTSSEVAKAYFESRAKQSTNLASISASNLSEMPLLIPPKQEQREIVKHITLYASKIDRVCKTTRRTIAILKERRSTLIAASVTGEVNMQGGVAINIQAK